ncbi:MAG TPA: DNA alkylation repair protein [Flavitalea sp.]|nr:DNA alkylation repair protein [Flavitalea sp.]
MTAKEILAHLKSLENESVKKLLLKHGAREPFYGVKIEELKKIQKKIKKDYQLSKDLYATGVSEAMYLAGLIADETKMTKQDLQLWVKDADWAMLSEFTVPWVAAESKYGYELGIEWIDSDNENIAAAGWSTFSSLVKIKEDSELDIATFKKLLKRVQNDIHNSPNRVRLAMNGFVIAVGSYFLPLYEEALKVGEKNGIIKVNMDGTACKVPMASEYIKKVVSKGNHGKKRKTARC